MRILIVFFMLIFLNIYHSYSNTINDTFQVDKQSVGYGLGWNLSWAENCNYSGYYNKFWKLYKKILATNDPRFDGIEVGWKQSQQADESIGCSEATLKQILNDTENLLNNSKSKVNSAKSQNIKKLDIYKLCEKATISGKTFMWRRDDLYPEVEEAKKRGLSPKDCGVVIISKLSDAKICQFATKGYDIKIWDKDKFPIHVEVADKRGLSCGVNKDKENADKAVTSRNKISDKTKDVEDKCAEIGFKKGTEKYGDCVLKMLELK